MIKTIGSFRIISLRGAQQFVTILRAFIESGANIKNDSAKDIIEKKFVVPFRYFITSNKPLIQSGFCPFVSFGDLGAHWSALSTTVRRDRGTSWWPSWCDLDVHSNPDFPSKAEAETILRMGEDLLKLLEEKRAQPASICNSPTVPKPSLARKVSAFRKLQARIFSKTEKTS